MSQSTGAIAPLRCNSHLCPECSPLHQMTARLALDQGIHLARKSGHAPIWLTLTEPAKASLDLPAFMRRWQNTVLRLRRNWEISEYGVALEFQKRGALHPHAILWGPIDLGADLADRKSRASYRRRMHELRPMARELGWGQMVDAVTIGYGVDGETEAAQERVARYASKSVADYATKEARAAFKRAGAKKIRPVRLSSGYFPGGLARARELVRSEQGMRESRDPGPWVRTTELATCGA